MSGSRLLVVGDEYYATLAAVRGLARAGYEPWLATTTDRSLAQLSSSVAGTRRVPHPGDGAAAFLDGVRRVVAELRIDAVLPGTEPSLAVLAGADVGARVGAPAPERVADATDKERLGTLAAAAGLPPVPSTRLTLPGDPPDVAFPAIVKPARSTVASGDRTVDLPRARRVDSDAELSAFVATLPPGEYVLQPYVAGALSAVAGVAWEGRLVCCSQQRALRIEPPDAGASAYAVTVPVEPRVADAAAAVVSALGWSGLFELQFIAASDGPRLIDFNPRFYGSLALAIGAGLNLPAIWADLLLGREPRIGEYRAGVHYRAEARDARLLAAALRRRDVRSALAIVTPQAGTVHAVFSARDPRPFGAVARRLRARDR